MSYVRIVAPVVLIVTMMISAACGGPADTLEFSDRELERSLDGCSPGDADCSWVVLRWPEVEGGPEDVRSAVAEWIDARMFEPLGDHWVVESDEDVAESLFADRAEFVAAFPDAVSIHWHLERSVRVLPSPTGTISLEYAERRYTGGAHGMDSVRLVSFDATTGATLRLEHMVEDPDAFRDALHAAVRAGRGLAPDADLAEAGFWVDDGALPGTDNVARIDGGVRVRYDAYEIGPYAMGPTDVVVP